MSDPVYVELPNRAEISVSGSDATKFLQGLITNDIELLNTQSMIYACLLTAQGKFLYDFFIRKDGETYLIDCEGGDRATALLKKLKMYKLRSDVMLELIDAKVFQIPTTSSSLNLIEGSGANQTDPLIKSKDDSRIYKDPRHNVCGYRVYLSSQRKLGYHDTNTSDPSFRWDDMIVKKVDFDMWDEHRIRNEIPDGSRDLIPEKSFIHEGRLDELGAVSYTKGCYVGQELVSRMHHRGLTKKILKCTEITDEIAQSNLRSSCNDVGLVITKIETSPT